MKSFIRRALKLVDYYGIPEILEEEATGLLKDVYSDIKFVLKVPIVNFIFRTLALYEPFLTEGWKQVRPNMLTIEGARAANALRHPKITQNVPKIQWASFYNSQNIEMIKGILDVFSIVNPKLLLIVSSWSEALANRPNSGLEQVAGTINPGIISSLPKIQLLQIPQAPASTRNLMLDIARKHEVLDVASDFRALAHFPQFLSQGWSHLRPYVGSDEYVTLQSNLKSQAIEWSKKLPYPVTLNRIDLESIYSPREIAGIMGLVSLYQNFIPSLIIDIEFLRKMLAQS